MAELSSSAGRQHDSTEQLNVPQLLYPYILVHWWCCFCCCWWWDDEIEIYCYNVQHCDVYCCVTFQFNFANCFMSLFYVAFYLRDMQLLHNVCPYCFVAFVDCQSINQSINWKKSIPVVAELLLGKARNEKRKRKQTKRRLWKANSLQCLSSEYDIRIRLHKEESLETLAECRQWLSWRSLFR